MSTKFYQVTGNQTTSFEGDILDSLAATAVRLKSRYRDEHNTLQVEHGDRHLQYLVHKACKMVACAKTAPIYLRERKFSNGRLPRVNKPAFDMTPTGRALLHAAMGDFHRSREEFHRYQFSPEFHLCEKLLSRLPQTALQHLAQGVSDGNDEWIVDRAMKIIKTLQHRLRSPQFRERSKNFRRNATENFTGLLNGIQHLASCRNEVKVLFFTISPFTSGALRPERKDVEKIRHQPDDPEGLQQFMAARNSFQKAMTAKFGKRRLGYAWALEHGIQRKYYLHYLLVLDKPWPLDDRATVDWLKRKWMDISNQVGHFHAGNCDKDYRKCLALATVRLDSADGMKNMQNIVASMTLGGLFLKLGCLHNDAFGKGGFISIKVNCVGRPPKRRGKPIILLSA